MKKLLKWQKVIHTHTHTQTYRTQVNGKVCLVEQNAAKHSGNDESLTTKKNDDDVGREGERHKWN